METETVDINKLDHAVAIALNKCRQQVGMTSKEFARKMRISPQQWSKNLSGINRLSCGRLTVAMRALNITSEEVFSMVGNGEDLPVKTRQPHDRQATQLLSSFNRIGCPQKKRAIINFVNLISGASDGVEEIN